MESQARQTQEPSKARRPRREIASLEKVKAVLAIWTERRTASQVCREMSVNRMQVDRWEEQALEGMLQAFERRALPLEAKSLGSHLEKLLERSLPKGQEKLAKLQERLERLQAAKPKERKEKDKEKEAKAQG